MSYYAYGYTRSDRLSEKDRAALDQFVLAELRGRRKPTSPGNISRATSQFTTQAVQASLARLVKAGKVERVSEGKYTVRNDLAVNEIRERIADINSRLDTLIAQVKQ